MNDELDQDKGKRQSVVLKAIATGLTGLILGLGTAGYVFDKNESFFTFFSNASGDSHACYPIPNEPGYFYPPNASQRLLGLDTAEMSVQMYSRFGNSIRTIMRTNNDTITNNFWPSVPWSFHIPRKNMEQLLHMNLNNDTNRPATGAQVYMGVFCGEAHLFMVPVHDTQEFYPTDTLDDGQVRNCVFDFIRPCPQICGSGALHNASDAGIAQAPWSRSTLTNTPCQVCKDPRL